MKKAYGFVVLTAFLFGTMEVACEVSGKSAGSISTDVYTVCDRRTDFTAVCDCGTS